MRRLACDRPDVAPVFLMLCLRNLRFAAVLLVAGVTVSAAREHEPAPTYRARRLELSSRLKDGITVVFGYSEPLGGGSLWTFRQSDDFYYLTGFEEPGAILML